jgi:phosphate transport system protein
MERHFVHELEELNAELVKMAAMAESAIGKSVEAVKTRDVELAKTVIAGDEQIDEWELVIEEKAIDLLALYQPMAIDLRFITTGMKINTELERISDLAVNIAECALKIAEHPLLKPLVDIPKLSTIARQMVKEAIDAFVRHDETLAKQVILMDSEADRLRDKVQDELINEYLLKDSTTTPRALPLLLVARHLERICDHATNIAEDVIYMINAKVVKHHPERLVEG